MIILGIETSCDETAVAVLDLPKAGSKKPVRILSNLIASQHEIHLPYGGIFPELASRRHIEVIRPLLEDALKEAGLQSAALEGIAVTNRPGLVGSLLVGLSFAKAYAYGLKIPFAGVNHLEGHLNAPFFENPKIKYPYIGMIVSGGHTALYFVKKFGDYQFLGGTRDDAAGEAFDKVAKILGLDYPGGPLIDKQSREGNDFSFSGLKTAVKMLQDKGTFSSLPDICASFQETVVDCLIEKTMAAAKAKRCQTILVTGGVACNSRLRDKFAAVSKATHKKTCFASPVFSTDNAAMIAYVGGKYLQMGRKSPLSLNAVANVSLESLSKS
ncbi:MAG: tRNA (adenosine(37)-N6)-threonylcarbamoyltransferase complex transferase subunit TsaD [Deltaproteobacteria bacterium]|nr:tRNA (adenosine(37)-N6)-threonylcarbamoyltransferase complex transferase subunit TsaD [Deltaproteobacteria bacterium]